MNISPKEFDSIDRLSFINGIKTINRILKENKNKNFDLILDIGCGHGKLTSYLSKKFNNCRIIAIDIDNKMIEYAKENYNNEKIDYNVVDITRPWDQLPDNIKLLKGKVDLAFSNWALHWIRNDDTKSVVENINNFLNTDGKFYLNILSFNIYPSDITNEERTEMQKFIKIPSEDQLKDLWQKTIIKNNLKINYIKYVCFVNTIKVERLIKYDISEIININKLMFEFIKHSIDEDKDDVIKKYENILIKGFFEKIFNKVNESENYFIIIRPVFQISGKK